jgi:hypothetical protein
MRDIIELRKELIEATRDNEKSYISYQDFAYLIDPKMNLDKHPERLKAVSESLSIISIFEYVKRRSLLSAVVSSNGMPGNGFYKLMLNLGIKTTHNDKIWSMSEQIIKNKKFWNNNRKYRKFLNDTKGLEQLEQLVKIKEIDITKDLTGHFHLIKNLTK